jgi:hypothetical protein
MNGAGSRRKGYRFEHELVTWLRSHGWTHAERTPTGRPGGDVQGIPGVSLEAKNHARLSLAEWTHQAATAARGALWVVVVKRRGTTDVGESYAVTSLDHMTSLLKAAGYGDDHPNGRNTP